MQLVEQHVINRNDPRYAVIDQAAFASKNLYNAALYESRQAFIHEGVYLPYEEMDKRMKRTKRYLPKCRNRYLSSWTRTGHRSKKDSKPTRKILLSSPDAHGYPSTSTRQKVETSSSTPIRPSAKEA